MGGLLLLTPGQISKLMAITSRHSPSFKHSPFLTALRQLYTSPTAQSAHTHTYTHMHI